eukprot:SM000056S18021  [mRNA]  locus=s56:656129:656587:- [translate_table: standard]
MVATATVAGAVLGLAVQLYSNAVRKLPLMRHPWEHVVGMVVGSAAANALVAWEERAQADLQKMLDDNKAANSRRRFKGLRPSLSHSHKPRCAVGPPLLKLLAAPLAMGPTGRPFPALW